MNGYLVVITLFGVGLALFLGMTYLNKMKRNRYKQPIINYEEKPLEYDDSKERKIISSDKIKQLKEKELLEKELKIVEEIQKESSYDTWKEVKRYSMQEDNIEREVRAGEVQANEYERFSLRKDEERDIKKEDEKWWI